MQPKPLFPTEHTRLRHIGEPEPERPQSLPSRMGEALDYLQALIESIETGEHLDPQQQMIILLAMKYSRPEGSE